MTSVVKNKTMKNIVFLMLICVATFANAQTKGFYENVQKKNVSKVLDDLNTFAANADFKNYFNLYAEESTFIGTDATEIWNKKNSWIMQNHISTKVKHGISNP